MFDNNVIKHKFSDFLRYKTKCSKKNILLLIIIKTQKPKNLTEMTLYFYMYFTSSLNKTDYIEE